MLKVESTAASIDIVRHRVISIRETGKVGVSCDLAQALGLRSVAVQAEIAIAREAEIRQTGDNGKGLSTTLASPAGKRTQSTRPDTLGTQNSQQSRLCRVRRRSLNKLDQSRITSRTTVRLALQTEPRAAAPVATGGLRTSAASDLISVGPEPRTSGGSRRQYEIGSRYLRLWKRNQVVFPVLRRRQQTQLAEPLRSRPHRDKRASGRALPGGLSVYR